MSRRPPPDLDAAAKRVDRIMQWGYNITEFSEYHVRIYADDKVAADYWPTSGRWRDAKGYKPERSGVGIESLKDYLRENHPLGALT